MVNAAQLQLQQKLAQQVNGRDRIEQQQTEPLVFQYLLAMNCRQVPIRQSSALLVTTRPEELPAARVALGGRPALALEAWRWARLQAVVPAHSSASLAHSRQLLYPVPATWTARQKRTP